MIVNYLYFIGKSRERKNRVSGNRDSCC